MITPAFKQQFLDSIKNLSGNRTFAVGGSIDFILPGLRIKDQAVSFPITKENYTPLLEHAKKAPFGKGSETIYDDTVRNVWEIDANLLQFGNPNWPKNLDNILKVVKKSLGLEQREVEANLYKLLIYEEGHFFLKHRDSEKETGMFGSLIIGLPSEHTGGSLNVYKGEEEFSFNFYENPFQINYAAFYADLEHEVKPISFGIRACLVYNLVSKKAEQKISYNAVLEQVDSISKILKSAAISEPFVITLDHQYTPQNFNFSDLKSTDGNIVQTIQMAADKSGYHAQLCLLTAYMDCSDESEYDSYRSSNGIGEIYSETLEIEHWAASDIPTLVNFPVKEENIISLSQIKDDEPIETEHTGYQGNYGMTVEYWYHYGAIAIWSKAQQFELLQGEPIHSKLEWISYYVSKQERSPAFKPFFQTIEIKEENIFAKKGDFNSYLTALVFFDDIDLIRSENIQIVLLEIFHETDLQHWNALTEKFGLNVLFAFFAGLAADSRNFEQMLNLINSQYSASKKEDKILLTKLLSMIALNWKHQNAAVEHFSNAIKALITFSDQLVKLPTQYTQFLFSISSINDRQYLREAIAENLHSHTKSNAFTKELLEIGLKMFSDRVINKPEPPKDFIRDVPEHLIKDKDWTELIQFLQNPQQETLEIRVVQNIRNQLIGMIERSNTDLKTTVIKSGSPHLLLVTKTTKSFGKKLKEWHEDVSSLNRLREKLNSINI